MSVPTLVIVVNCGEKEFQMGQVYEIGKASLHIEQKGRFEVSTAILWFRAMEQIPEAQNCLGIAFLDGIDVNRDLAAAYFWFKSACNLGCLNAMSNLAYMYIEGLYVARNCSFARFLVEEAAARGCPHAENNLGVIIGFGLTEEADETLAKVSFAIAAKRGVAAAQKNLELIA